MTTAPFTSIYPSAATEKNVTKFMSVMDGKAGSLADARSGRSRIQPPVCL
jgi:hypothetical protein